MFEDEGAAGLESPPSTDGFAPDPSSAGTQNTEQQPGQPGQQVTDARGNVIPGWRVNELVQRATDRAVAQARQEFQQQAAAERAQMQQFFTQQTQANQQALLQSLSQRATTPSRTPEEERERQQAQGALNGLLGDNPEWAQMRKQSAVVPQMGQLVLDHGTQLAQIQQMQGRLFGQSEEGRLREIATEAGMTFASRAEFADLNDRVALIIERSPQAVQAWAGGDARVLPAAFKLAKQQLDGERQRARASFASTKAQTQRLPPRMGGGAPGSPPIPKYDPKDPRGSMAKVHAGADAALQSMLGG